MFERNKKPADQGAAMPPPPAPEPPKEKYQMAFPEGATFDGNKCDLPGNFSINKSTVTLKEYFKCGGNLVIDGGSMNVAEFIEGGNELTLSHTSVATKHVKARKIILRDVVLECDVEADDITLTAGSRIKGTVVARNMLHVMPDCAVEGTITALHVRIDPGSLVLGQVHFGPAPAGTAAPDGPDAAE